MRQDKNRVFVSYVRDNSDDVNRICEAFLKNGIEYWLDRDQIEPGKIWKQTEKGDVHKKIN